MSVIKNLQQKPESTRKRYVVIGALVVTVLIVVLWIPTLGTRFKAQEENTTSNAPSPIGSFVGTVKSLFSGISYQAESVKKEIEDVQILIESLETVSTTTTDIETSEFVATSTEESTE